MIEFCKVKTYDMRLSSFVLWTTMMKEVKKQPPKHRSTIQ